MSFLNQGTSLSCPQTLTTHFSYISNVYIWATKCIYAILNLIAPLWALNPYDKSQNY